MCQNKSERLTEGVVDLTVRVEFSAKNKNKNKNKFIYLTKLNQTKIKYNLTLTYNTNVNKKYNIKDLIQCKLQIWLILVWGRARDKLMGAVVTISFVCCEKYLKIGE